MRLKASLDDHLTGSRRHYRAIENLQGELIGALAWSEKKGDLVAEVCWRNSNDEACASDWFYFDGALNSPAQWKRGELQYISQDEGFATFEITREARNGNITAVLKVGPSLEETFAQDEVRLRSLP